MAGLTLALSGSVVPVDVEVLMALATACRDHEEAKFGYQDHGGHPSQRATEPLQLVRSGQRRWYLVAWDLEREAWRTFRVDRIAGVVLGPRVAAREFPGDVTAYVTHAISRAPFLLQAEFVLDGSLAELAPRVQAWMGALQRLDDTHCTFTTGADNVAGVLCHLLLVGAPFQLREPASLGPELRAAVERLSESTTLTSAGGACCASPPPTYARAGGLPQAPDPAAQSRFRKARTHNVRRMQCRTQE